MGNRGKGLSKGKGGKNGKGKKGKKGGGGGASKWGDEGAGRENEQKGHPVKKKRRLTQEAQDRQRRMKIMELNRTKDREQRQRLSQPNTTDPAEVLATKPKKRKRKKRPRGDKPPAAAAGRDVLYYSSSDDDNVAGGKEEEEEEEEAKGGFDAGLASYKKLLSALEAGGSGEDKDLAAAVVARRMQREGRDDSYGSSSSSGSDSGEGEEGGKEEEEADDDDSDDSGQEGEGVDREGNGAKEHGDNGEENLNGGTPNGRSTHDVNVESDIGDDSSDDDAGAGGGGRAAGRSRDEFCRHFVSTSVFPPEKATELFSNRGRPSFKPLFSSAARSKWDAAGLSAVASHKAAKQEEKDGDGVVPPPLPKGASVSAELGVLPSLERGWEACNDGAPASQLQSLLLPSLTGYRDMLYCGWRDEEAEEIRRCYALHALNHALTSRRRVVRHTARLRKAAEEARVAEALARAAKKEASSGAGDDAEQYSNGGGTGGQDQSREKRGGGKGSETPAVGSKSGSSSSIGNGAASEGAAAAAAAESSKKATVDSESDDWQRDQGFTRPKVLILLPFRGLAHEVVEMMIELLGPKTVTVNKGRFDEEYGPDDDDDGEGGIEGVEADGTKRGNARAERAKAVLERKPGDWKALLGEGRNVDDMFSLGISLSPGGGKGKPGEGRGVGVRLYCDFYNSDIIVASPVALHRASVPGDGGEGDGSGGVDSDFLSSVEVCILDRADVFLMQNWSYVPDIAEVLNSRPTGERASRADFSRVRPLFLHEQGRLFRQTLVFSAFQDPNLNAFASRHLRNHDGVVKVSRASGDGHICEVALQAKQVFQRVPCESLVTQDDSRFEYFVGTVLPQVLRAKQSHTAVFIPSYFDYVRVRNHLMKNKASVVNVHEYSRGSEVARSRARFYRGDRDLLLYTGRAHFFNRYCIRGIHHLIFYSLPECPQFYPEMVNLLEEAESVTAVTCLSLFTRFERLSLERIVGEERAGHMLASAKNTFLFC